MSEQDDELLLGPEGLPTREARDTDGDGVSDAQEALDGTDAADASDVIRPGPVLAPDADPRADLERPGLEENVAFDPAANLPDDRSITGGLDGLTNLDGSAFSTDRNHFGIGDEKSIDGVGGPSPVDVQRDPAAGLAAQTGVAPSKGPGAMGVAEGGSKGTGGATESFGGAAQSGPPPGAELGSRAPNMDLVSGKDGGTSFDILHPWDTGKAIIQEKLSGGTGDEGGTPKPEVVRPEGDTKIEPVKPPKVFTPPTYQTNPDADAGGLPTQAEVDRAVAVHGGDSTPVRGEGAPEIEGDAPPGTRPIDLVTDPGDEVGEPGPVAAPTGPSDAPVIRTINPGDGITGGPPPTGGDGGGGGAPGDPNTGFSGDAATAATNDGADGPGISLVGSSPSGISSIEPDDPAAAAVDEFATGYLQDAALPDPGRALVDAGLAADLGGDLGPVLEESMPVDLVDPGGADLLEGSLPGDDDGLGDG